MIASPLPKVPYPSWLGAILLPFLVLAAASSAQPALAQPVGIGFAQAEEGTWSCRAGDPVTALNCARDLCQAEGGGQACFRTTWCFPAGWAGVLTVWTADHHANHPICGMPSLEALLGAMRVFCDNAPDATACDVGMVTHPFGMRVEVAEHWDVGAGTACDAARAQFVVGQPATPENLEAAREAAGAAIVRTIRPGEVVTMEFRADRLTMDLDAQDIVREVRCG
jgi:hypothetical protein